MVRIPLMPFRDQTPGGRLRWFLFLPGATVCGLGLGILLVPDLLRFLIAGLLLLVGAVLLLAAWQMRFSDSGSGRQGLFASFQQRVWRRFH